MPSNPEGRRLVKLMVGTVDVMGMDNNFSKYEAVVEENENLISFCHSNYLCWFRNVSQFNALLLDVWMTVLILTLTILTANVQDRLGIHGWTQMRRCICWGKKPLNHKKGQVPNESSIHLCCNLPGKRKLLDSDDPTSWPSAVVNPWPTTAPGWPSSNVGRASFKVWNIPDIVLAN